MIKMKKAISIVLMCMIVLGVFCAAATTTTVDAETNHSVGHYYIYMPMSRHYTIFVQPEPNSLPTDTYSIIAEIRGEQQILADGVEVGNIPPDGLVITIVLPTLPCDEVLKFPNYELISETRLSRTEFEYAFRLRAANCSERNFKDVIVQLVEEPNNTTVLDGTVEFSLIGAGTEVLSDDTFKVRIDRSFEGFVSDVVWQVCDCKIEGEGEHNSYRSTDFKDFATFAQVWLSGGDTMEEDFYPDGEIDLKDLSILLEAWLR